MDHGEILVMERETVQGRGRRPRKSNLSALRGQGRPGMEKMLTSVIACLVAVGGAYMPRRSRTITPSRRAVASVRSVSPLSIASARLKNPRLARSRFPKLAVISATLKARTRCA
jgi:hypothetical protein